MKTIDITTTANPMLENTEFIKYDQIKPEHLVPATEEIIKRTKEGLNKITDKNELTFENVVVDYLVLIDEFLNKLKPTEIYGIANNTPEFREELAKANKLKAIFYSELEKDAKYEKLFREYYNTDEAKAYTGERRRYLDLVLKEYDSKVQSDGSNSARIAAIELELNGLKGEYQKNLMNSTFELVITDKDELEGFPNEIVKAASDQAEKNELPSGSFVFNLDHNSITPFLSYSRNCELKKEIWYKFKNRGTEEGKDNRPVIEKIQKLKHEKAKLQGFNTFAELKLDDKMVESPEQVIALLNKIGSSFSKKIENDYQELLEFRNSNSDDKADVLEHWDSDYWFRRLKEEKYSYSDSEVKEYFPLESCLDGLFDITGKLFGLSFEKTENIPTWHDSVLVYKVFDEDSSLVGHLFLDIFERSVGKFAHNAACCIPLVFPVDSTYGKKTAQVSIFSNFNNLNSEKPTLLTYPHLYYLFHEFGHALSYMLVKAKLPSHSMRNLVMDVLEFPSEFMVNYVNNKESLKLLSKHYKTGEKIPDGLLNKFLQARKKNDGINVANKLIPAEFDIKLHNHDYDSDEPIDIHYLSKSISSKYVMPLYPDDVYPEVSYPIIYTTGYASCYYNSIWSNIFDADAFSMFEESGDIFNSELGRSFRKNILEMGNTEDMNILFEKFRGRALSEEAIMKRFGVK